MLSEQEQRKCTQILESNRKSGKNQKTVWDYDEGEIPEALEDPIGIEIVEYVLEEDDQYSSSPQIVEEIETDASPKKVGSRMRLIGRTLGMNDNETDQFYSGNSTWDFDALKENDLDELYKRLPDEKKSY